VARSVLITGGAGFIGCRLARLLLDAGDPVQVFDNLHPQVHSGDGLPRDLPPGVEWSPGDVTVESNWSTLFKLRRPEVIIHLAAETGTGQSLTEAHRHASVNVSGTALMLDALTRAGHVPAQILLASSRAVYGDGAWRDGEGRVFYPSGRTRAALEAGRWDYLGPDGRAAEPLPSIAGETPPHPVSIYAATKLAQEHLLSTWCRAFGSALTVLRLQNVYGPGQSLGNPYTGVLTLFVQRALKKQALDVYEDGKIVRDFVHVDDVARAAVEALAAPSREGCLLDIGSGSPTTIGWVATEIARRCEAPAPVLSGRFRDGDVRAASCSIAAARRHLGFEPRWTLQTGLESLIRAVDATRG
jgi:dTDP-L-rhamnose 4-epimerase